MEERAEGGVATNLSVLDALDGNPDPEPPVGADLTRRAVPDAVLEAHEL